MSNTRNDKSAETDSSAPHLKITRRLSIDAVSGLLTGAICSGLFNPWDRALYLSVVNKRPFLSFENFTNPYHGLSQAVVQRAFLGGLYFVIQGQLKSYLHPYLRSNIGMTEPAAQFCIGLIAGSANGVLTNGISAAKYHTWGDEGRTFFSSVYDMWTNGGYKPFIKGTAATVSRDAVFGSTYEVLRHLMYAQAKKFNDDAPQTKFLCDSLAAGTATIASGPFNYVRSMQYATPPNQQSPSLSKVLKDVWLESNNYSYQFLGRVNFFQERFRVGWGTVRVAIGMGFGQWLFGVTRKKLAELNESYRFKKR
jgi:hypothetical protein